MSDNHPFLVHLVHLDHAVGGTSKEQSPAPGDPETALQLFSSPLNLVAVVHQVHQRSLRHHRTAPLRTGRAPHGPQGATP